MLRGQRRSPLGAILLLLAWPAVARAEGKACQAAYEEAQVARSESRLLTARDDLASCMRAECPGFVRDDCARWLNEVELALPSIVLVARSGATELEDFRVSEAGTPLVEHGDGKAVSVDPGRHVLHFEASGQPAMDVTVLIHEGDKNRVIEGNFPAIAGAPAVPAAPAPAPAAETHGSVLPYALLGVGAVGLAGFTTFALVGNSAKHRLERTCAPGCTPDQVSAVHTKYVIGDVSLALGAVAIGAASYLLLSRPAEAPKHESSTGPTLDFVVTRSAGLGTLKMNF